MIRHDSSPIRGRVIVAFVVLWLLLIQAIWLLDDRSPLAVLTLFFSVSLISLIVAMAPMGRVALPALGFRRVGWRPIVLGTVGALIVSVLVTRIGVEPEGIKQAMEVARKPTLFAVSLAVMAGFAPLVEELVFRGLLYGWVAGRWGSVAAWIVSSLAFAAAHVELAHVILVLPLGLWFGWLRRRTDSLWPSLAAHMANNGLAVAAAALLDA